MPKYPRGNPARLGQRPRFGLARSGVQLLDRFRGLGDLDAARFQRLGDLAHQIDVQHAVLMVGTLDADMVGQREAALKGAGGDAAMQKGAALVLGSL